MQGKYLYIDKQSTIDMVKREFTERYPFLSLELLPKATGSMNVNRNIYKNEIKLDAISLNNHEESIIIHGNMKVSELEMLFGKKYGIQIQVYRKSGNVWLEISATDNWTLDQQNEEGRSLLEELRREKEKG